MSSASIQEPIEGTVLAARPEFPETFLQRYDTATMLRLREMARPQTAASLPRTISGDPSFGMHVRAISYLRFSTRL